MRSMRLPNFVIIGAVKAATTWSAKNLAKNPQIFIPGPEPHFFSNEYDRGLDWYTDLFRHAPADSVIGEKSADYLASIAAAERMAKALPNAKLIVQLRNPIARTYSDYCMLYRRGTVAGAPDQYFSSTNEFSDRILKGGLYAQHLVRYYDHFLAEDILIVPFEDISSRPVTVLERMSDFIGVTPHISEEDIAVTENDSQTPILPLPMRKALRPFKGTVSGLRNKPWFKALHGVFARPIKYPTLSADAHSWLAEYYSRDIERLSDLVGQDFNHWLKIPPRNPTEVVATGEQEQVIV